MRRPFPQSLALFNLAELAYWRLVGATTPGGRIHVEAPTGDSYVERRRVFREATEIDELPVLGPALDQYGRNLSTLIAEARRQDLRLVLATQPAIYSDELSPEAADLLWFGMQAGGERRYSVDVMMTALNLFNARLLATCRAGGAVCVDLAAEMSGVERYFYDDVHFNEAGARAVAEVLARAGVYR